MFSVADRDRRPTQCTKSPTSIRPGRQTVCERWGISAVVTREEIEIKSESESEFLILAGPDINEPIARYGPFVMNTREEINQAFLDYQNGTFAN